MDEFLDILIVLASIAFMIVGAVRKEKKNAAGRAVADFQEDGDSGVGNDIPGPEPVIRAGWKPSERPSRPAPVAGADAPEEGTSAISHQEQQEARTEDGGKPFTIDRKKLVLYHEIMKPKFDE